MRGKLFPNVMKGDNFVFAPSDNVIEVAGTYYEDGRRGRLSDAFG